MTTRKVVCAVVAAIAAGSPAQSMLTENEMTTKTVQLTHAGASDWSIAVPAGAGEVEQFAASELRKYIGLMSGAGFPQTTAPASGKTILVGRPEGPEISHCAARREEGLRRILGRRDPAGHRGRG